MGRMRGSGGPEGFAWPRVCVSCVSVPIGVIAPCLSVPPVRLSCPLSAHPSILLRTDSVLFHPSFGVLAASCLSIHPSVCPHPSLCPSVLCHPPLSPLVSVPSCPQLLLCYHPHPSIPVRLSCLSIHPNVHLCTPLHPSVPFRPPIPYPTIPICLSVLPVAVSLSPPCRFPRGPGAPSWLSPRSWDPPSAPFWTMATPQRFGRRR